MNTDKVKKLLEVAEAQEYICHDATEGRRDIGKFRNAFSTVVCADLCRELLRLSSPFAALLSAAESKHVSVSTDFVSRWAELIQKANVALGIAAAIRGGTGSEGRKP